VFFFLAKPKAVVASKEDDDDEDDDDDDSEENSGMIFKLLRPNGSSLLNLGLIGTFIWLTIVQSLKCIVLFPLIHLILLYRVGFVCGSRTEEGF